MDIARGYVEGVGLGSVVAAPLHSAVEAALEVNEGCASALSSPLFSIATASYNRAGMIEACIRSCLEQSFRDFEIVVVDGASTDDSVEVIRKMGDPRIRLVVQPENVGISAGRHEAVIQARGEWVLQLDSDHTLFPEALQVLKEAIDRVTDPAVGAVCARYQWDTGRVTPATVPNGVVDYEQRMSWVESEGGSDCVFCARRTALLATNWFGDRRASMDALFHLNFSQRWKQLYLDRKIARQVATIEQSSTRAHKGRARMLQKWAPDMAWQYVEILRRHGPTLAVNGPKAYRGTIRQAAIQNFYAGNRIAGISHGWRYLREAPFDFGFWPLLAVGAIAPRFSARLNEARSAVRNLVGF